MILEQKTKNSATPKETTSGLINYRPSNAFACSNQLKLDRQRVRCTKIPKRKFSKYGEIKLNVVSQIPRSKLGHVPVSLSYVISSHILLSSLTSSQAAN